jgi:hypothetical protein
MPKEAGLCLPPEKPHVFAADTAIVDWVRIIRAEYLEIPPVVCACWASCRAIGLGLTFGPSVS